MVPRSQLRSRPGLTTGITADDKSEIFLQSDIGPSASQRGEVIFDERSAHSGLELVDGNASRSSVAFPVPKVELNRIHPRVRTLSPSQSLCQHGLELIPRSLWSGSSSPTTFVAPVPALSSLAQV